MEDDRPTAAVSDFSLGVAVAIRSQRPGLPVVVEQPRERDSTAEPLPAGCVALEYPCSVRSQIDALLRAEAAARRTP